MGRKIKFVSRSKHSRLGYKRQSVNDVEVTLENSTKDRIHALVGMYDFYMSEMLVYVVTTGF
jgi:hypothetical protein